MATDRLSRLLAALEAQGIDAARLRSIRGVPCSRRCDHPFCDRYRALRALAAAAAEPERAERCPTCGSDDPAVRNSLNQGRGSDGPEWCEYPWHDGASR